LKVEPGRVAMLQFRGSVKTADWRFAERALNLQMLMGRT